MHVWLCRQTAQSCTMQGVTLASLITERRQAMGGISLRDLAQRAAERGYPISPSTLSAYSTGKRTALPELPTREALAAALGVSRDVVEQAAGWVSMQTLSSANGSSPTSRHALAWTVLTESRTDEEIDHLLSVVRTVLQGLDAQKNSSG